MGLRAVPASRRRAATAAAARSRGSYGIAVANASPRPTSVAASSSRPESMCTLASTMWATAHSGCSASPDGVGKVQRSARRRSRPNRRFRVRRSISARWHRAMSWTIVSPYGSASRSASRERASGSVEIALVES